VDPDDAEPQEADIQRVDLAAKDYKVWGEPAAVLRSQVEIVSSFAEVEAMHSRPLGRIEITHRDKRRGQRLGREGDGPEESRQGQDGRDSLKTVPQTAMIMHVPPTDARELDHRAARALHGKGARVVVVPPPGVDEPVISLTSVISRDGRMAADMHVSVAAPPTYADAYGWETEYDRLALQKRHEPRRTLLGLVLAGAAKRGDSRAVAGAASR
jgi:hypothetical protein